MKQLQLTVEFLAVIAIGTSIERYIGKLEAWVVMLAWSFFRGKYLLADIWKENGTWDKLNE